MIGVTSATEGLPPAAVMRPGISIATDNKIVIPQWIKRIGLSGNFPTPLNYLNNHDLEELKNCKLGDFIDVTFAENTVDLMLRSCEINNIQLLIVNSPPASYAPLSEELDVSQAASIARTYLDNIQDKWKALWEKELNLLKAN